MRVGEPALHPPDVCYMVVREGERYTPWPLATCSRQENWSWPCLDARTKGYTVSHCSFHNKMLWCGGDRPAYWKVIGWHILMTRFCFSGEGWVPYSWIGSHESKFSKASAYPICLDMSTMWLFISILWSPENLCKDTSAMLLRGSSQHNNEPNSLHIYTLSSVQYFGIAIQNDLRQYLIRIVYHFFFFLH